MRPEISTKITTRQNPFRVNLAGLKITDDEIAEIIGYIKDQYPAVTKINLDNNLITDIGAKTLSEYLRVFPDVQEISIQFNKIGKFGAIELFHLKNNFSRLDILFHGNNITDVGEMEEIVQLALSATYRID